METKGWIDSHSHLADLRLDPMRKLWIESAKAAGIALFSQGGVGPEDWEQQKLLAAEEPSLRPVFGLHPYWVSGHSEESCESALDQLARELSGVCALGETGLDFRPQYAPDLETRDRQVSFFEKQLELCHFAHKPAVLHLVRAFDESLKMLQIWGVPPRGAMIHSFNGSWPEAEQYLKLGLKLSVGGPLLRQSNEKLRQAVREIPLESLMIETDSPDQSSDLFRGQLFPPASLIQVAQEVARIHKVSDREVLDRCSQNCRQLFSL